MKKLALCLTMTTSVIIGCAPTGEIFADSYTDDYIEDDRGIPIEICPPEPHPMSEFTYKQYLKENNLPKGTLYWVCEGEKAVLPKDCQGNSLTTPQLRRYWKKYDLPVGTKEFNCEGGVPTAK